MKRFLCFIVIVAITMMTGCERTMYSMVQRSPVETEDVDVEAIYAQAELDLSGGDIAKAAIAFGSIADYEDAAQRSDELWEDVLNRHTLCAGNAYTLALYTNGRVEMVGDLEDVFHKEGYHTANEWMDIKEVAAAYNFAAGLRNDGNVVVAGDSTLNELAATMSDVVTIEAYGEVLIALRCDGTVKSIGRYGWSWIDQWTDIMAVCSGGNRLFGVSTDGTVCVAGDEQYGNCDVEEWTDIVAVDASEYHTVGLKRDGTVVATGFNGNGQCDVEEWADIVAISVGKSHTLGLKCDGTVVATGLNLTNQCEVSSWKDIVAVSAGSSYSVGLKRDGTVVATPYENYEACKVDGMKDVAVP